MDASENERITWFRETLSLWPGFEMRVEYEDFLEAALGEGLEWAKIPALIQASFASRGWAWNGVYLRESERALCLVLAAGPPVCAALGLSGGVGSSGMCWDAVLTGRTLCSNDVHAWPGYVSCDGQSGLRTVAGMVCPLRDPTGQWSQGMREKGG